MKRLLIALTVLLLTTVGVLHFGGSGGINSASAGGTTTTTTTIYSNSCYQAAHDVPDGPDEWGTCWPGPSNTGPTGTLTTYVGDMNITAADTVIDSMDIQGCVQIANTAYRTIISNSRITCTTTGAIAIQNFVNAPTSDPTQWVKIGNTEVSCNDTDNSGGISGGPLVIFNDDIHDCTYGVGNQYGYDWWDRVTDSYIHDLHYSTTFHGYGASAHLGTFLSHNSFWSQYPANLIEFQSTMCCVGGATNAAYIQYNLFAGGAFEITCPSSVGSGQNKYLYYVSHNRYDKWWYSTAGAAGANYHCGSTPSGWADNIYDDTRAAVPRG